MCPRPHVYRLLSPPICAVIYWITGIPLSVYFWYRRLYNAARDDGTVGYIAFFLFFSVHIAFCIWCAIGE